MLKLKIIFPAALAVFCVFARAGEPQPAVEMRLYDVSSLIAPITDFPGPDYSPPARGPVAAVPVQAAQGGPVQLQVVPPAAPTLANIAEMIHDRVRPDTWDPALGTSIDEKGGMLVVMQTPEIHKLISQMLNEFVAGEKNQVAVKGLLMTANEIPKESCFDAAALAKLVSSAGEASVLARPRVVCYNTQRTNIVSGKEFNYVGEYNIVGDLFEPAVRTGLDGYVMDVKPVLSGDKKAVQVELRFTLYANVQNHVRNAVFLAIPVQKVSAGEKAGEGVGAKVPVEIPELEVRAVRTQIAVPEGQWVLAGTFSNPFAESRQKDKHLLFFIAAELVKPAK